MLVCDEPVASLDVSIQAQIINLLLELRQAGDLTMLFISHDLGVVRHLCDRVAVMYLGRIVEIGPKASVYADPKHPYTRALIAAVPRLEAGRAVFKPISGEIPSPRAPPAGCAFHPRCSVAQLPQPCRTSGRRCATLAVNPQPVTLPVEPFTVTDRPDGRSVQDRSRWSSVQVIEHYQRR